MSSSRALTEASKKIVDFTIKNSEAGFAGLLSPAGKPRMLDRPDTFIYSLTPYVCHYLKDGSYRIPVSTAMAIFDELSTLTFMTQDKTHRPGVSIFLDAKIVCDQLIESSEGKTGQPTFRMLIYNTK